MPRKTGCLLLSCTVKLSLLTCVKAYAWVLVFSLLRVGAASAQSPLPAPGLDSTHVYTSAQSMPHLPGYAAPHSEYELIPLIHKALLLPAEVRTGKVEGQVVVSFIVGPSGVVKDATIKQGLSPVVDEAVLKAMTKLPRFVPGRQNGQPVAVSLTLPLGLWGPEHLYTAREVGQRAQFPTMGYVDAGVAYRAYVRDHLRVPAVVAQQQLRGRIEVSFVVEASGRVRESQVVKGLCPSCDEEVVRLVRAMPTWRPARNQLGQAVPSRELLQLELPLLPPEPVYQDKVYSYVERSPEMPGGGGTAAISAAIRKLVVGAGDCNGQVFVSFTVKADGTIGDPQIVKGLGATCDAATLAAVVKLPRFKPGQQSGQAVAVGLTVPVRFTPTSAQ
jgi:TonB family protein